MRKNSMFPSLRHALCGILLALLTGCGNDLVRRSGDAYVTPSYRRPEKLEKTREPKKAPERPTQKDPRLMSRDELISNYLQLADPNYKKAKLQGKLRENSLDFLVKNGSGKTIFVTCFSYVRESTYATWRWDKSPVYRMYPNDEIVVDVDEIADKSVRENVFGYLAIFDSREEALQTTPQLVDSRRVLDLDLLDKLHGKTVTIEIEKYGYIVDRINYKLQGGAKSPAQPELDFEVENQTGKPILLTCFVYQQQQDVDEYQPWSFAKTPVKRLNPKDRTTIDISTIKDNYDWIYMRGNLAVFDIEEEQLAEESTYELLNPKRKLALGRLSTLAGRKIILEVERFGSAGEFFDYITAPTRQGTRHDVKKP